MYSIFRCLFSIDTNKSETIHRINDIIDLNSDWKKTKKLHKLGLDINRKNLSLTNIGVEQRSEQILSDIIGFNEQIHSILLLLVIIIVVLESMLLIIGRISFETTTGRVKRVITEALRAEIRSVVLRLRTRGLVWESKLIRVVRERGIVGGCRR